MIKILSISDVLVPFIYSAQVRTRFRDVQYVISCGDLPYYYQEYIISMLDVPLFFVHGNHDKREEHGQAGIRKAPEGGINLHNQAINFDGLLLAGVEGSLRYREGDFQYSQTEMWLYIAQIVPSLLRNRAIYGRYLDIFVTHAPVAGVHDRDDLPHRGIDAFRWLINVFQPACHFHGHVHVYRPDEITETLIGRTRVINTYGFRETLFPDYRQIKTGLQASRRT